MSNEEKEKDTGETESDAEDTDDASAAGKEEDVSERWDDQKRQQAVETLLGSCAGSDFEKTAAPPQVLMLAKSDN